MYLNYVLSSNCVILKEDLPLEIKQIIISFSSDATKRQLRLANTKWFNAIDYRKFILYLTRKEEWKQIVDRFEKYTKPISLVLSKNIVKIDYIIEHLTRLTNMTSINVQTANSFDKHPDWNALSVLTNLKSIAGFNLPYSVLKHMTQLEIFESHSTIHYTESLDVVKILTNLHTLYLNGDQDTNPLQCITDAHSKITTLQLFWDSPAEWTEKDLQRLSRLKTLIFNVGSNENQSLSLKYMTDLEELYVSCPFEDITTTKLHTLTNSQFTEREKLLFPKMASLTSLGPIVLEKDSNYLSVLTNLMDLTISTAIGVDSNEQDLPNDELFSFLGSLRTTKLHSLEFEDVFNSVDFGHLTRHTSLQKLRLRETWIHGQELVTLTNLTHFRYYANRLESDGLSAHSMEQALPKLTKLQSLTYWPSTSSPFRVDLSPLTDITDLVLGRFDCTEYYGLNHLTNVTYLQIGNTTAEFDRFVELPFLAKMTNLRSLSCKVRSDALKYVPAMTNLELLDVVSFDKEEEVLALTALKHLAILRCAHQGNPSLKGIHLPLLTRLEQLYWPEADFNVVTQIKALPYMYSSFVLKVT